MKTMTKPAIKIDVLRAKMDAHVIDHIEDFIMPELRYNRDAIRWAYEWRQEGVSLNEINNRLHVLESEYIQSERVKIMEEHEEEMETEMEANAWRDGIGPETGIDPHTLDQMSIGDINEMEQQELEEHNDTYYLHF